MATWFRAGRGFAVGALVGALALGSGTPHLVNALAVARLAGGAERGERARRRRRRASRSSAVREGPYAAAAAPFHPGYVRRLFGDRAQRLVCFGYFGHMWELYAMWTWVPAYAAASFAASGDGDPSRTAVELAAFAAVGVAGLAGCVLGGVVADVARPGHGHDRRDGGQRRRAAWPRRRSTGVAPAIVVVLMLVWGMAVVADSAQFSTALTEVADLELRRDGRHGADRDRVRDHGRVDPAASDRARRRGVEVRVPVPRGRAGPRHRRDGAGTIAASWLTAGTPRRSAPGRRARAPSRPRTSSASRPSPATETPCTTTRRRRARRGSARSSCRAGSRARS